MPIATTARIVIVGAEAAGMVLANHLVRRRTGAQIALIDARTEHLYQPGLSLVAAGLKPAECRLSRTTDWLPQGITLLPEHAAIDPISKTVATTGGQNLSEDVLVMAPGLGPDRHAIVGFSWDLVGTTGIGALYASSDRA